MKIYEKGLFVAGVNKFSFYGRSAKCGSRICVTKQKNASWGWRRADREAYIQPENICKKWTDRPAQLQLTPLSCSFFLLLISFVFANFTFNWLPQLLITDFCQTMSEPYQIRYFVASEIAFMLYQDFSTGLSGWIQTVPDSFCCPVEVIIRS